jgi:methionyl-tRNA formyltransferase
MSLRLVFAGTPEFAVPCLRALLRGPTPPVAVYTQPDRPAGRGRRLQPSPVKRVALEAGVEVFQPASLKDAAAQDTLRQLAPDLLVVVAYGLILPAAVLAIPRHGGWNVHASLLPRWRGAAPIQRAIEAGDHETGVCLMQMEKGLDTGPVLLRIGTDIRPEESAGQLHDRLALLGAEVLGDGIGLLRAGLRPVPQAQPAAGVTHARKLDKAEARLDWQAPAEVLARRVRAFNPWPIADAEVAGERLRIHRAVALPDDAKALPPGSIVAAGPAGLDIACASGCLRLLEVQREGGRAQPVADFLNARPALRRVGVSA